jgi:hypothetical protein
MPAFALDTIGRAEHGRDDAFTARALQSRFRTTSTTFGAFFVVLVPMTMLRLVSLAFPGVSSVDGLATWYLQTCHGASTNDDHDRSLLAHTA